MGGKPVLSRPGLLLLDFSLFLCALAQTTRSRLACALGTASPVPSRVSNVCDRQRVSSLNSICPGHQGHTAYSCGQGCSGSSAGVQDCLRDTAGSWGIVGTLSCCSEAVGQDAGRTAGNLQETSRSS